MAEYKVTARIGADGSGFMRTVNSLETRAGRFASTLRNSLGSRLAGLFSIGAIGMQMSKAIQYGSQLSDLAVRSGETVEQLQRLNKGLEDTGTNLQELEMFWEAVDKARMRALRDPEGLQAAGFAKFGIGQAELSSMGRSALTAQIASKFQGASDWQSLVSTLSGMRIEVGNLVESFRGGLYQMNSDMRVMTTAQAQALDAIGDRWVEFGRFLSVEFAPVILGLVKAFRVVWAAGKLLTGGMVAMYQGVASLFSNQGSINDNIQAYGKALGNDMAELWNELRAEIRKPAAPDAKPVSERDKNFIFEALDPRITSQKRSGISPISDSLLAVGNFLGAGRVGLESLANRQVQLLDTIAQNTKRMADNTADGGFAD